jgi:hypothetical protein
MPNTLSIDDFVHLAQQSVRESTYESDQAFQEFYRGLRDMYKSEDSAKATWDAAVSWVRGRNEERRCV